MRVQGQRESEADERGNSSDSFPYLILRGTAAYLFGNHPGTQEAECLTYDSDLLLSGKLRVHRQRDDFQSDFFGDRKISLFIAEALIRFLEMEGNRIMDAGVDIRFGEMFL